MVWYGMVWYGMVWYGMVWYGMVWYGMVWYGMVWYGKISHLFPSYYAQRIETASNSIHNIGTMALLHPTVADICIEKLFSFLQSRNDSIVSHSLAALRGMLPSYLKGIYS